MKKFIALFALLCALAISSTASADWELVCTDAFSNKFYIETNSILDVKDLLGINQRGYYVQAIFATFYSDMGRNEMLESRRSDNRPITSSMQNLHHGITLWTLINFGEGEYMNVSNGIFFTSEGLLIPEMCFVENGSNYKILEEITEGKYSKSSDQFFNDKWNELIKSGMSVGRARRAAKELARRYQGERVKWLESLFFSVGLTNGAMNPFGLQCLGMMNYEDPDATSIYLNSNPISTKNFIPTNDNSLIGMFVKSIISKLAMQKQ